MDAFYDAKAPKRPTNLSCNSDLLRKAKALGINLSAVLEQALEKQVRERLAEEWRAAHRGAVEEYNKLVEEHGVFSKGMRSF
jgi:antitoxin CcdA